MITHQHATVSSDTLLAIQSLSVDYLTPSGTIRAVNRVDLSMAKGETLGLAGESGCGKSTLAFAVTNLHKAPALITEGGILYKGNDLLTMTDQELRKVRWSEISIVFQSAMNSLNPVITIGEQIIDVLKAHTQMSDKQLVEKAGELLGIVGIHADRLKSFPHQLSGGMRQRVAIAIALALEPKLIVMDEPTTALDVVVEKEIMDELQKLKEQFGFSILFISHDLSLMGEITDRIGVMYGGNLVELGKTQDIIDNPQHPYTKGLLASFPKLGDGKKRLQGIPGSPLNLLQAPQGCYFQERCERAQQVCQTAYPAVTQLEDGSCFACHFPLTEEKQLAG